MNTGMMRKEKAKDQYTQNTMAADADNKDEMHERLDAVKKLTAA